MSDILKNIFYLVLIATFAQPLIIGLKRMYEKTLVPHTKVGYLEMKGMILESNYYIKQLKTYFKDDEIKAVLLKIDAGGGVAGSSQAIFHEILELKNEFPKPLVVLVENICGSGAYWVACAADHIVASPVAWVGSIGAVIPYRFKLKQLLTYHNVQYEPVKAGEYKNFTNPFTDTTPAEMKMMQELVDDTYKEFTQSVASRRSKLSLNKVNVWANGKVFTGRQALELGLIDELGTKTNATTWLKEKALIEGKIEWVKPPKPSFFSNLFGQQEQSDEGEVSTTAITQIADAVCNRIEQRFTEKTNITCM